MILIPARNEGPRIGEVLDGIAAALPGVEVVVVANGCTDDTVQQAEDHGATVVSSEEGYAEALLAGYAYALECWGDEPPEGAWAAQLDADGQHPPDAIPDLVRGLTGAHMVVGSRWGPGSPDWMGRGRRWGIAVLSRWARLRGGPPLRDVTSGMQAFRPEVVRWLARELKNGRVDANLLVALHREGFVLHEVPVAMGPRLGGASQHGGLHAVAYSLRLLHRIHREALGELRPRRKLKDWVPAHLGDTLVPP